MTTQDVPPYGPGASIVTPPLVFVSTVAVTTVPDAPFAAMLVLHVIVASSAATPLAFMTQVRTLLVLSAMQAADCAAPLLVELKPHADAVLPVAQIT